MLRAKLLLYLLPLFSFLSASSIVGNWIFDSQSSIKKHKELQSIYKNLEGMQLLIKRDGRYIISNRGSGRWKKSDNGYLLLSSSKKQMQAQLEQDRLIVLQKTSKGAVPLYFKKGNATALKSISNYIYLDRIYYQKSRVYDNGYLYYLFLPNGTFYSYVSTKKDVTKEEIKKRGDRLKYAFRDNKIELRGPFRLTIKAVNKATITTSQNDRLYAK